jgi:hypothetical protein
MSISSLSDHGDRPRLEEGTQTSYEQPHPSTPRLHEMTQTSFEVTLVRQEPTQPLGEDESSPDSAVIESPITKYQIKSWEELGIVDYYVLKDLRSGVS